MRPLDHDAKPTSSPIVTWATFALYPHKGLIDHKLITGHSPWLDGFYLVDIITVVAPCMLAKSLEVQFLLRANKVDQTYNVFKGDDFVIGAFVSECYLPILAASANAVKFLSASQGTALSCLYFFT